MAVKEKFVLRWNEYSLQMCSSLQDLREASELFDITLAVENKQILAHKLVLSASSLFFRNIIKNNPHQHPLFYLKGVKYSSLAAILNFMYNGEVSVAQDELTSFLNVAEDLRVKGLIQGQDSERSGSNNVNSSADKPMESHKAKSVHIEKSPNKLKNVQNEKPVHSSTNSDEIKVSKVINQTKRTKPVDQVVAPSKRLKPSTSEVDFLEIETSSSQKRSKKSTSEKSIEHLEGEVSPHKQTNKQHTKRSKLELREERKSTSEADLDEQLIKEKVKSVAAALTDGLSKNEIIDSGLEITAAPGLIRRSGRKTKQTYKTTEPQLSLDGSSKEPSDTEDVDSNNSDANKQTEQEETDQMDDALGYGTLKTEITIADTELEVGNIPEIPVLADQEFDDENLFTTRSDNSSKSRNIDNTNAVIATLNEALDDLTKDYVTQVGSKDWKCLSCSKLFYNKMQSQTHVEADHLTSQGHVCPTCFTQFPTIKAVKDHVLAGHKRVKEEEEDEVLCVQDEIPLIDL